MILGTMFVLAMSILRFPYALLVGVLIALTALIPIAGAFIGCAVGALLMLRPMQSARALTVLLGIGMMLEGVLNLCVALFGIKIIRHQRVDGVEARVE